MERGGGRVIISTIYEGHATRQAIQKLSPDKLILLIDEPQKIDKKEKMYELIKTIKEIFKDTLIVETIKVSSYDIPKIMEEVVKTIDKEYENNQIILHITEGRKLTSLALLFSGYMRKEKINEIYYITEEEHKLIPLPLLAFQFNDTKKDILKEISKGNKDMNDIRKKINLSKSATYQNIQELKKEGYLENNKELNITDFGRMMFL